MVSDKIITYISLAKKSGSLFIGFDRVKSSILIKKAKLVIFFNDASDKTKKETIRIADINNVKHVTLTLTSDDLYSLFNKKVVVISITNINLSSAILNLLNL